MTKITCTKKFVLEKLNFQYYQLCLKATQLEVKLNQLKKNKLDVNVLRQIHKDFPKSKKIIWKSQQRLRSERDNVFTKLFNKIALNANDDKII